MKSLFWPSIRTGSDVDYLGTQGFWVCAVVAVLSFGVLAFAGHAIAGGFVFLIFYVGGVGVRERSRYAAAVVLAIYVADALASGGGVVKVLIAALLLSNFRATWIASRWKPGSDDAILPPRFSETWADKFADKLPLWLWPKVRIPYYVFSIGYFVLVAIGLAVIIVNRTS